MNLLGKCEWTGLLWGKGLEVGGRMQNCSCVKMVSNIYFPEEEERNWGQGMCLTGVLWGGILMGFNQN
jgi:hypothetical protein